MEDGRSDDMPAGSVSAITVDPLPAGPSRLLLAAAGLQLAVPMLTAGAFFIFRGDATDLNDPHLPMAFRLMKDVAFSIAIAIPLGATFLTKWVRVPPQMVLIWLMPLVIGLLMMLIGHVKAGPGYTSLGFIRNIVGYYGAAGGIAILAWWYGYSTYLFRAFRILMALSVLLGLSFYVFAADSILLYTIHGRMIGTLANPNFLGYACFLWIVIIHALAAARGGLGVLCTLELLLAISGLGASASINAILCFGAWGLIMLVMRFTGMLPSSPGLTRTIRLELVALAAIVVIGASVVLTSDAIQVIFRLQLLAGGQTESTSVRAGDLGRTFDSMISARGLLVGQTSVPQYVQFDGTNQSFLFNFGVPLFLLWSAFILSPVLVALGGWRRWATGRSAEDWLAMMLAPAILVSFLVAFWIQYVAEKYPTCVLIGFCMYFVVLHSLPLQRTRSILIK